jgi:hypothetical protein
VVEVGVEAGGIAAKTCQLCLAFSQLAHPASHAPRDFPTVPAALDLIPESQYRVVGTDVPTPRSRGPPHSS